MTAFAAQVLAGGAAETVSVLPAALGCASLVLGGVLILLWWLSGLRTARMPLAPLPPAEVGDDVIAEFGGCSDTEIERAVAEWSRQQGGGRG